MTHKPKLLWHSNSPLAGTGYGVQTALFTRRLKDHFDTGISAFYGVEGSPIRFHDMPVYPGLGQTWGNETIRRHAAVHFGGDIRDGLVFTLQDVWPLDPGIWSQLNVAHWTPVDHEPCPPPVAAYLHESGAVPVAMSKFGETQLKEAGLEPLYVPHGVDTQAYKPLPQAEAREKTKLPKDAFIVGMVAANKGNAPSRKSFVECFEAFKAFKARHPEAVLYLHTELTGMFQGVNLPEAIDQIGIDRDAVMFCDQYRIIHYPFNTETMANVYSSLDVLLMPSQGEGFGIPAIEAQACGVPIIVSDYSAQPELLGAGWTVSGQRYYTAIKAWMFTPDIEDILDALEKSYAAPEAMRKAMATKARTFAEGYDVEKVMDEHMLPVLNQITQERFGKQEIEVVAA